MRWIVLLFGIWLAQAFGVSAGQPTTEAGLEGIPDGVIASAERAAWLRDYNNFVYRDDLCYDRAVEVIAEVSGAAVRAGASARLHRGAGWSLGVSNVAKLMLIYPYSYDLSWGAWTQVYRWRYHIATVARDSDGRWCPIDPDATGRSPESPEAWLTKYARDLRGEELGFTGLSLGTLFPSLPPSSQVYLYWMPADFYQPVFNADSTQLFPSSSLTLDPLSGWTYAMRNLQTHRRELLAQDGARKISGADVLELHDADRDGIPDDVDQCNHTPYGTPLAKIWRTGPFTGCTAGEIRDRDRG